VLKKESLAWFSNQAVLRSTVKLFMGLWDKKE